MEIYNQPTHLHFNFYQNSPKGMILLDNPMLPISLLPRIGDTLEIYFKDSHQDMRFHTLKVLRVCWVYQAGPTHPILNSVDIHCENG